MGKIATKVVNIAINSVALEDEITNFTLGRTQELAVVNGFSSVGPERVVGNYDYSLSFDGSWDGAASQGDATIAGTFGSAGVAMAVDPTGNSAGASDPNYDATLIVVESYNISGTLGGPVTYSATYQGASALTRAVV